MYLGEGMVDCMVGEGRTVRSEDPQHEVDGLEGLMREKETRFKDKYSLVEPSDLELVEPELRGTWSYRNLHEQLVASV